MTLFDYTDLTPPAVQLQNPVFHPHDRGTVIGHTGIDNRRPARMASFPRNREDHYFQKYDGYAISESVLHEVHRNRKTELILVVEVDGDTVYEYDISAFLLGDLVAYSPEEDTVLEGEMAVEYGNEDIFRDRQRVAPTEQARREWDADEVVLAR